MPDAGLLIPAILVASTIAVLSLLRGDARIMRFVTPPMHRAGHFACYAAFAWLCVQVLPAGTRLCSTIAGFLVAAAFGIIMEFLQKFRPGRAPSRVDAMFNAAGAALGALFAFAFF